MALSDYPATIPGASTEGFELTPKRVNVEARMSDDVTRQRTVTNGDTYIVKAAFSFKFDTESIAFNEFFKYTINYGDYWFAADWFAGIGFTAGLWAFKIIDASERNFAYKLEFDLTMLMMLKADAPEPGDPWPTTEIDVGFLDQRFGTISPVSDVASGASTTVFDLEAGEGLRGRWKAGWFIDFYDKQTLVRDSGPYEILSVVGDTVTLVSPAAGTPDNTLSIWFSEYDDISADQKIFVSITDDVNNFPSDSGKAYRIMYG